MTPLERPEPGLTLRMKAEARRIANQHSRLEELRDRVTAEISRLSLQGARTEFERFADALEAHFAMEEKLFLPAIGSLDPELGRAVEELLGEHRLLRRRVSDLMDHFAMLERDEGLSRQALAYAADSPVARSTFKWARPLVVSVKPRAHADLPGCHDVCSWSMRVNDEHSSWDSRPIWLRCRRRSSRKATA